MSLVVRHAGQGTVPQARRLPVLWMIVGGISAALAVAFWMMSPGVRFGGSARGLASYRLTGWGTSIQGAQWTHAGAAVPLVGRSGRLEPAGHLAPNESGYVEVMVTGPSYLRWLPWESQTAVAPVSAPAAPRPLVSHVERDTVPGLSVQFSRTVVSVQYRVPGHRLQHLTLPQPSHTVTLPIGTPVPGEQGTVWVQARARTWEPWASAKAVHWAAVPYLDASASATQPIQPTTPLTVQFSQPVRHPHLSAWTVRPAVSGAWHEVSPTTFSFTPSGPGGYGPGALVEVTIPGGAAGPVARSGSVIAHAGETLRWTTPPGSILRLQELLAVEGYLPVSWKPQSLSSTPTLAGEDSTIYSPPAGLFTWKYAHLPKQLQALWTPGQMSPVTQGAIMQFERANGLPVDGIAGPEVWGALIRDRIAGETSPWPYTYISVTESSPETVELWVGNRLLLTTKANTGIPATPTYLGTFPIYERLRFQIMRGKNPNGTRYADPVYWINYFKGSDAVHGFVRASYGFPQSLGCVEVPPAMAQTIFNQVHYGTLVTVNPPGIPPAPAS